jgi:2-polyprenyl-3-methyl-5-hydroxy-6-metoxy-1,4-benzoquinol methylase
MCDKYSDKENYVAANVDVTWWAEHPNGTIVREFNHLISGHILDIGCNHGATSIVMASLGNTVTGVDISDPALEAAHSLLLQQSQEIQDRIDYVKGCLLHLPFDTDTFDGGYMFDVLEHIYEEDQDSVLSEISRVMKPGAYVYIIPPYLKAHNDWQHVFWFDENSATQLLSKKFEIIHVYRDQRKSHDRLNCLVRVV